jgi:hypothetical protein
MYASNPLIIITGNLLPIYQVQEHDIALYVYRDLVSARHGASGCISFRFSCGWGCLSPHCVEEDEFQNNGLPDDLCRGWGHMKGGTLIM